MSHIRKRTQKYSHKVSMMIFCELILKGAKKLFLGCYVYFFVLDFRWTAKKFLNELCCIICNSRGLNNYPISDETSLSHKNASKKYP